MTKEGDDDQWMVDDKGFFSGFSRECVGGSYS